MLENLFSGESANCNQHCLEIQDMLAYCYIDWLLIFATRILIRKHPHSRSRRRMRTNAVSPCGTLERGVPRSA